MNLTRGLLRFTRRRLLAMAIDAAIVLVVYYVALSFRFAGNVPDGYDYGSRNFLVFAMLAVAAHLTANWLGSVYSIVSRYIGLIQATHLVRASLMATAVLAACAAAWPAEGHLLPLSVVIVGGLAATVTMLSMRFYGRIFYERSLANVEPTRQLLLVGAGQAADMIIREINRNPQLRARVVGLVDDRPELRGMRIHNHPVLGSVDDVPAAVAATEASEILIAIPSATPMELSRINRLCRPAGVPVQTLPSMSQLMDGSVSLCDAHELDIQDLLGRPKVETDLGVVADYLAGRRILVTGAAGSIGSELSRQIATFGPAELLLVDRDESALYHLHEELRSAGHEHYQLVPTDILQKRKISQLLGAHRPHVVFHAAAFKHVPLMELSPDEAVLNNVKGTLIMAEAAGRAGVERFVNISTDKAVDPVNVMGATKRVGENLIRMLAPRYPATRFCSVRFGNVLGSRGSVVPIFRHQIAEGGPVTVTHPEMTRYFMMIEEAVQLVLQAAAFADAEATTDEAGPDPYGIFVLEMGAPVRILDLAHQMLDLLGAGADAPGRTGAPGIAIEFTGLRPGERLHEALFCRRERPIPTSHPKIYRAGLVAEGVPTTKSATIAVSGLGPDFEQRLRELIELAESHEAPEEIVRALQACIPVYQPFDWKDAGAFPGVARRTRPMAVPQPAMVAPQPAVAVP